MWVVCENARARRTDTLILGRVHFDWGTLWNWWPGTPGTHQEQPTGTEGNRLPPGVAFQVRELPCREHLSFPTNPRSFAVWRVEAPNSKRKQWCYIFTDNVCFVTCCFYGVFNTGLTSTLLLLLLLLFYVFFIFKVCNIEKISWN